MSEHDEVLAYLPLAWVGDHYLNYAQGYAVGLCMSCPESPDTVSQNLREIGPTFYFAPPRVFENLLTSVMIRMEDASRIKKWLFDHYLAVAQRNMARRFSKAVRCRSRAGSPTGSATS
jgi:long-chain acyl-CoA synthetase